MVRLLWIIVCLISLAIGLMCGLAAVTVLAAIVTGNLTDPEAWKTAVFLAAVGCLSWFLCRAAWRYQSRIEAMAPGCYEIPRLRKGHAMSKRDNADNLFRPSDSPLTEHEKDQIAARKNLERLRTERLAREAEQKDSRKS